MRIILTLFIAISCSANASEWYLVKSKDGECYSVGITEVFLGENRTYYEKDCMAKEKAKKQLKLLNRKTKEREWVRIDKPQKDES